MTIVAALSLFGWGLVGGFIFGESLGWHRGFDACSRIWRGTPERIARAFVKQREREISRGDFDA